MKIIFCPPCPQYPDCDGCIRADDWEQLDVIINSKEVRINE